MAPWVWFEKVRLICKHVLNNAECEINYDVVEYKAKLVAYMYLYWSIQANGYTSNLDVEKNMFIFLFKARNLVSSHH